MDKAQRTNTTYNLTTSEAAALLGVDDNTVRSWAEKGRLPEPHRLPSGHARYSLEQLLPAMPPDVAAQYRAGDA